MILIILLLALNIVASYEDAPTSSSPGTRSTPGSLPRDVFDYLSNDLHILDGYKVSSLNCLPGTAAINAMYFPSPFQLTTEIKSKFVQNGARDRVDSKTNLLSLSASCSPPSRSAEHGTHCEHLMSRLWIIILESIAGLKHCRKLDNFDCKAVYALSNFLSTLISLPGVLIPDQVLESLNSIGLNVSYFSAAEMAWKMFEKRRPTMIVALWREDKGKANRFDQVCPNFYFCCMLI